MPKILVVNSPDVAAFLEGVFREEGDFQIATADGEAQALSLLEAHDLVVTDFSEGAEGNILGSLASYTGTPCLVCATRASYRNSVEAIKQGAFDYLALEDSPETVKDAFHRALACQKKSEKGSRSAVFQFDGLVGESAEMGRVFKTVERVATSDSTVLITGESGTGKELIARAIHQNSRRARHPMVTINCGAIPRELLESELFGHEKGSFTGAHRTRLGRFEVATGGTIFLDEIGDMSPDLQVKLLRVLQEQSFERVGSTSPIKVDIRVIAATHKDLLASIEGGTFREDLYYRLNVIPIRVPALRQRKSDIPLLVQFFMNRMGERHVDDFSRMKSFSPEALNALIAYSWPGNIRELENMMERLSVLVEEEVIAFSDLPGHIRGKETAPVMEPGAGNMGFADRVDHYQRTLILEALREAGGVKAKAAERLRMNRTTLVEKIKKLKIDVPEE